MQNCQHRKIAPSSAYMPPILEVSIPEFNKLETTPTPNKNGSYGIKGGGGSYAIFWGSVCHIFCRNPLILTDFYAIQTPIVWHILGHIFCKYGGWGWSELFFLSDSAYGLAPSLDLLPCRSGVSLADQTNEGQVCELLGKEFRTGSRTLCSLEIR